MKPLRIASYCKRVISVPIFSIWRRSTCALDDILGIAPGTWGTAAVRFIVARKYGCAARYGVLLARRGLFFIGQIYFFKRCMKSNCESCRLENDTFRLHSYCVLHYLNVSSLCYYSLVNKKNERYSAHISRYRSLSRAI